MNRLGILWAARCRQLVLQLRLYCFVSDDVIVWSLERLDYSIVFQQHHVLARSSLIKPSPNASGPKSVQMAGRSYIELLCHALSSRYPRQTALTVGG